MGFERSDEGELDDQKAENIKDEKDDDIRENEDDTIWDEIEWSEDNSKEQSDSIWNEIDWSEDNSKEQSDSIWNEIDWTNDNSGEKEDSIWNEIDWTNDNSGEKEDSIWNEINWNEDESGEKEINERENLDDKSDTEKNNSNEQQEERNEEDLHENLSSQSTSTVLVSENIEEIQEVDHDQDELDKEIEKELEEGVEAINQHLEEEVEFINAYQEMVGKAREIDEVLQREGEEPSKTGEEWEKEVETAAYTAEQLYENMNEKEAEQNEEVLEPQLSDLQEEFDGEERDEVEQHQVEPLIEEELETEVEPIVDDIEIEELQEMELEEQFQMVHDKEYIEELVETQLEMEQLKEQQVETQINNPKENVSELHEDLKEERDEIEQHQVEALIKEEIKTEPEPMVNEKEIKELQEIDIEEQFQKVNFNEYIEELVEKQEEEKTQEHDKMEQEKEKIKQNQEILHQSTYLQEELEEQEQELELEYEEKDEVEQHQVEAAIEEELEAEPKPIIREEEIEYIKNFEPEKQLEAEFFYELIEKLKHKENEEEEEHEELSTIEKVAQIKSKLGMIREIKSGETEVEPIRQEEVLEHEINSSDVSEQNKRIEQEVLNEIGSEEDDSDQTTEDNHENFRKLYKQQTGKRPIYASQETKGFKQWLEQRKETEKKEKTEQKQELKEEQKKDETWKWTLNNRIEEATEIEPELKSVLKKLVEKYNKLEKLIKKYSQLYNKAQLDELSKAEKNELKALIKALQKIDHIKIAMLLGIREIKRYIDEQYYYDFWDKQRVNQIFSHFFTQLAQKYKNLRQAQKKNEKSEEILTNWIENASLKEISINMKAKLRDIAANYDSLNAISLRFMKLHNKKQKKQLSENEKNELKNLNKILCKIEPFKIQMFSKLRAIKKYLNDYNGNLKNESAYRIFSHFFTGLERITISPLFNLNFEPLTSKEIIEREVKYQKILDELCVQYALEFKDLILKEYGKNIMEMNIPLSAHFGFRLDKYIRKVSHLKRDRAVGVGILERVRAHIVKEYNKWDKNWVKEASLKKIMSFIEEYKEYSLYVSGKSGQGKFSISNIRYEQDSEKLAPKSWLIENLRYLFPKKFGLPLHDNLLSWLIFGDNPSYGRVTKLKWTMDKKEISKRINIADLLAIDYRVNKLIKDALGDKGIKISDKKLELIKKSVSFLVFYYIFGGYHDSTYVSETTSKGLPVGKNFFTIEYEVIRAIFFASTEENDGVPVNFEAISSFAEVSDLKHHLYEGFGFGDDYDRLLSYFKHLSLDSSSQIFKDVRELLNGYLDAKRARSHKFQGSREYRSSFQGKVHKAMQDFFGIKFVSEEQVRSVVKDAYIDTINDNGIKEKIYVHGAFSFDLYFDLNKELKDYLGLDAKWKGLAIEAMGTYWHNLPRQIEADRKKRLICKERCLILLEIPEALDDTKWCNEALKQFKEKTGVAIPPNKLNI